jgi:hypothetical protein
MIALTTEQEQYVKAYCLSLNTTEAAIHAGYAPHDAASVGLALYAQPEVQLAIRAQLKAQIMSEDETLARISAIARADMADLIDQNEKGVVTFDINRAKERGRLGLIKSVKYGRHGIELQFHSSLDALKLLSEYYGLTGKRTAVVMTAHELSEMSDDELDDLKRKIASAY